MTLGTNRYLRTASAVIFILTTPGCERPRPVDIGDALPGTGGITPLQARAGLDREHIAAGNLCIPRGPERLRSAADNGQVPAQAELGKAYLYGRCELPTDSNQAAHWLTLAAERGDMYAQKNLAFMYQAGQPITWFFSTTKERGSRSVPGIPQDYAKALAWYRRCADQGNVECQSELSGMFDLGEGSPQDRKQSYYWRLIAARNGSEFDRKYLFLAEKQLSQQDIDEVRLLVEKWHPALEYPVAPLQSP
jgi:hypothetical protein